MKSTDVLVVGGSAAGLASALASKSHYPGKSVTMVRKEKSVAIPCGIPYIFGTLEETNQNILPDGGLIKSGVEILVDEVTSVDGKAKTVCLKEGGELSYDKLIIATGSRPVLPGWLPGAQLENVFTVPKNLVYLDAMKKKLDGLEHIVVIGAGFIGIEMSDELKKTGKNVSLVELQANVLPLAFDPDIAGEAETILKDRGINVLTGHGVEEIVGVECVEAVKVARGDKVEIIKADAVILSMGYEPNVDLARDLADVTFNRDGFIKVDEYMRTDHPDVFAVGDCAVKRDFFTRKAAPVWLASTATAEARNAGTNIYGIRVLHQIHQKEIQGHACLHCLCRSPGCGNESL